MADSDAPIPLIRTGLRDKVPHGLSNPVGAEAISRALHGCPQYHELWTAFGSRPQPLHPAPAQLADFRLAFAVVCNNNSNSDERSLKVPAVPSEERAIVHRLLVAVGLPGVRDWLDRPRSETWYNGLRVFQVGYKIEPLQVCFVESLNRSVLGSSIIAAESFHDEPCAKDRPSA